MYTFRGIAACALLALGVAAAGCSQQTIKSANEDLKTNAAKLEQGARKVEQEAKPTLDKLGIGARVTAALKANANLPGTIRVDADTNGVRLRGSVKTEQQKALAGQIARQTLPPDKAVSNELAVKAG
jgi:osmotically-inducible protein OsmY